ncbi:MAG: MFS transporter, partial [Desulfobacterales bacterium]|nr:MFS transporter [Desulfobacterales bacterium]
PLPVLTVLLLCAGFASGSMIISFAFIKESAPAQLAGTVSGLCNMGVMGGPMILQPAVGLILDLNWRGDMVHGVKQYSLEAFQLGFSLMLAWLALGSALILLTRETRCEQMVKGE